METLYLDTHVVIWLYEKNLGKFSEAALDLLENSQLFVSPMVTLEIEFLHEIKRVNYNADTIIASLSREIGVKVCSKAFDKIGWEGIHQKWTRDPFDRLIVANASIDRSVLLTKDQNILDHYELAKW